MVIGRRWEQFSFLHVYHHYVSRRRCAFVSCVLRAACCVLRAACCDDMGVSRVVPQSVFAFHWLLARAGYSGDIYYPIIANSFIHVVMYFYYFLSSVGPKPWWAKYLTMMQMIQFVTMIGQCVYLVVFSGPGCDFPFRLLVLYLVYIFSLLALFLQFYFSKHGTGAKPKSTKQA
jgi:hypothetical protein